jgi:hypothetical protein
LLTFNIKLLRYLLLFFRISKTLSIQFRIGIYQVKTVLLLLMPKGLNLSHGLKPLHHFTSKELLPFGRGAKVKNNSLYVKNFFTAFRLPEGCFSGGVQR